MRNRDIFCVLMLLSMFATCGERNEASQKANLFDGGLDSIVLDASINELKQLGDEFYEQNDYSKAIVVFDRLILSDSVSGDAYFKRGYSRSQLIDPEGAKADYLKAADLGFRAADAYHNTAIIFLAQGDEAAALSYLRKAKVLDPRDRKIMEQLNTLEKRMARSK